MTDSASDEPRFLLARLTPTAGQRRTALIAAAISVLAFAFAAPFAAIRLPEIDVFIPATQGILCANDLFTAVLLFSQFSTARSPALLVLAAGYLFAALILIPHALTFPGAFTTSGLLGADENSAPWLYLLWHACFPAAILVYALLQARGRKLDIAAVHTRAAVTGSVVTMLILVASLTWFSTGGARYLPHLVVGDTRTGLAYGLGALDLVIGVAGIAVLSRTKHSVLDLWLLVVMLTLVLEVALVTLLTTEGFQIGFYAGRVYALATSVTLLIALIAETARLEARLARSNVMLQRERNNRLVSATAVAASISHEVRKPLMSIAMNGGAAARFLAQAPPDYEEVKSALDAVVKDSQRTSQIFESIGGLFRGDNRAQQAVDLNEVTREVLEMLKSDLHDNRIKTSIDLAAGLPKILGHHGQLQEVVINLVTNAIEAMSANLERACLLEVKTERHGDGVAMMVRDSGPGIPSHRMDHLFDAFITSKSDGMGLGLAVCRMIVEHHGGQLSAISGAATTGACFRFVLPGDPRRRSRADRASTNRRDS